MALAFLIVFVMKIAQWRGMMQACSTFICTGCQKKIRDILKSIAITLILDYGNENVLALIKKKVMFQDLRYLSIYTEGL